MAASAAGGCQREGPAAAPSGSDTPAEGAVTAKESGVTAPAASAEQAPAVRVQERGLESRFFHVVGVSEKDVLNLRAAPDAAAPALALIPPKASHVRGMGAVESRGQSRWQRVNYGGLEGWVNAKFLALNHDGATSLPAPPEPIDILVPLVCFGTEPFWSLRFGADGLVGAQWDVAVREDLRVAHIALDASGSARAFTLAQGAQDAWMQVSLSRTGRCSDGMSDGLHEYEFAGKLQEGNLTGCCRQR